jgi:hypothetical protein
MRILGMKRTIRKRISLEEVSNENLIKALLD